MGVKDLWNIISPSCERKPLYELQGKVVAIDLSGWVVDSQSIVDNVIQPKMHLRNLFFRTAFLLMNDVYPVFVLEGTAPSLKHKTIAKRNEIRNGPTQKKSNRKGGRGNFNKILKECESMLKYMGISCIRGQGEAEAMCALLNAEGLVDGCISQDSDCFLYGAKVVYRNFCTSAQGKGGATGGSIDEYTIEKIQRHFDLGRNKMIALALLCGCDYDDGINGVGKEAALKLFKVVNETNVIERMKSWKTDYLFTRMETELANPNICTTCGHSGKMRSHLKSGCNDCGTLTKCNDGYKEKRVLISNELSIRKKTLLIDDFPSEELINEFLQHKDTVPTNLNLKWKIPDVHKFVTFMEMYVLWEPEYAYAKILPLLTRWQVRNIAEIPDDKRLTMKNLLIPERIKKPRNIKGIATYEIVWEDKEGIFKGMTLPSTSDKEDDTPEDVPATPAELATLEPQHLVEKCYPQLVEDFENAKLAKKKKPAKPRAKKVKAIEDATGEKAEEKKKAQRRPRKPKASEVPKNRKMDEFMKANIQELEDSFDALTITPKRKKKSNDAVECEIKSKLNDGRINSLPLTIDPDAERLNRILNGSLLRMFNELTPEDFPSEPEDGNMSVQICDNSQIMDVSIPRNQNTDTFEPELNTFEPESNTFEPEFNTFEPDLNTFEPELDLKPKVDLEHKLNLEPQLDLELKLNLKSELKSEIDSENLTVTSKLVPHSKMEEKSIDSSISNNTMNESKNVDCTLKRIIDSHKNVADLKKKPFTLIKSPNVFAVKKPKKKFDAINFTFEKENSPEPKINYKISDDCIKRSALISNLLNNKSCDKDDSMEKFERLNASLERYLFGQKLFKDSEKQEDSVDDKTNVRDLPEATTSEQNDSKIIHENALQKHSVKNKYRSHFSLERSLHVQNLIKDIKDTVTCPKNIGSDSVLKKSRKKDIAGDIDSLNSSFEHLRFSEGPNVNFQTNEIENREQSEVFNLSEFEPKEKKSSDDTNDDNSLLELLLIPQQSDDNINISEISVHKNCEKDETTSVMKTNNFYNEDIEGIEGIEETDRRNSKHEDEDDQIANHRHRRRESIRKYSQIHNANEEIVTQSTNQEEANNIKESYEKIERIIPDEIDYTDESDMFDFSSECSMNFESPQMKLVKEEEIRKSIRKSTLEKLKLSERDESIDEFDLLISNCKPLHERLVDLGKEKITRTSTPDIVITPGKKFSFGIDDLLNDTDL